LPKPPEFRVMRVPPKGPIAPNLEVAYLIINIAVRELAKWVDVEPKAEFKELVSEHLHAYIVDGKMPPEDIAPAILNLADDYAAARPMNLRAGDYIALQNHVRRAS
jgi:hypothetical protein